MSPQLDDRSYSRAELARRVGRLEQAAGVRLVTLGDGIERGVRVLEFRTGTGFAFDVIVDRAFDVGRCDHNGRSLAWLSPTGFAGPWFYEPDGLGFLRSFGAGLVTTCGLDHVFAATDDTATRYHYPAKRTESYGLHGRLTGRPAKLISYGESWDGDECVLHAVGEVAQTAVFGEQLLLRRRIEARVGESRLIISDEVVNAGHDRTSHMLVYHVNLGWPLVDKGSEIVLPVGNTETESDSVTGVLHGPRPGYVEQVGEYDLVRDAAGQSPVALINRRLGLGIYEVIAGDELQRLVVWRMLAPGTYVIGLEPSTNRLAGRHDARVRGELIELEAGESRSYRLEIGALVGSREIDDFVERISSLRSSRLRPADE